MRCMDCGDRLALNTLDDWPICGPCYRVAALLERSVQARIDKLTEGKTP